jgi:hypothetical protein
MIKAIFNFFKQLLSAENIVPASYTLFANKDDLSDKDQMKLTQKINLKTQDIKYDKIDGVNYLIVPAVMLMETVVNGALVKANELLAETWNGVPVTVDHPHDGQGNYLSANSPKIIEKFAIGTVFNARVEDKKLKAEVWIDVNKANKKFPDFINKLTEDGSIMEVSTGYFAQDKSTTGTFNDKNYDTEHFDIKPDHFALLPNCEGACSVEAGCGIRANDQAKETDGLKALFDGMIKNIGLGTEAVKENNKLNAKNVVDTIPIKDVVEALKVFQSDLVKLLNQKETNMTKEIKANCMDKEDVALLKELKAERAEKVKALQSKVKEAYEWEDAQVEGLTINQLESFLEKAPKKKSNNTNQNYSGRANAENRSEDNSGDYSKMTPPTLTALTGKKTEKENA